jgi:uncharacterized protein
VTGLQFEWDEAKNLANQRKHGVSFEEASNLFLDPFHVVTADQIVNGEQRWQALGMATRTTGTIVLLLVAHTMREESGDEDTVEVIRIISARKTTSEERKSYEDENG